MCNNNSIYSPTPRAGRLCIYCHIENLYSPENGRNNNEFKTSTNRQ